MKDFKKKIISFLEQKKIEIISFKGAQTQELTSEQALELEIKIETGDTCKWEYFAKRVNGSIHVVDLSCGDNFAVFSFEGNNAKSEEESLTRKLEIFYDSLLKRYYTVCPEVEVFSVLLKPTHRCNLDCKYCYDKPYRETIKENMSLEIVDRLLQLLSQYTQKAVFIWHGGEPTMVDIEWYKRVHEELIPNYPMIEFEFSIMSNGINFNEEWFKLFEKYNIKPGVSYQAFYQPELRCSSQIIQNQKKDLNISRKIEKMLITQRDKSNEIGVIDVISKANYKEQIRIYEYYKKLGINVCMNNIFHTKQTELNDLEVSAEEYAQEFLKYFKYWLFDKKGISERGVEEALALVIGDTDRLTCKYDDCRYKWIGVNPLGEIYPCDCYFPDKYKTGTIFNFKSIKEIFASDAYQLYSNEVQKRFDTVCKECGYWFACKGECNGYAIETTGSADGVEKFICELFRLKYVGIYEILRDLDWVDNREINPHVRRILIENSFFSVKEIKDFMKEQGKEFELEYNRDNLLECSEYKIFRGINYQKNDSRYNRHVDFADSFDEAKVKINKDNRKKDLINYLKEVAIEKIKPHSKK